MPDSTSATGSPPDRGARRGLAVALGAAVAASACCTVPLLLVSLGVGGAWVGSLTAFEPFRPLFITVAVAALGYVGWREWRAARLAASGVDCDCEDEAVPPRTRYAVLGVGALAAVLLLASPWLVPQHRQRPAVVDCAPRRCPARDGSGGALGRGHVVRLVRRDRGAGALGR